MGKTIKRRERKSKCGGSRKGRGRKGRAAGLDQAGPPPVKAKRLTFEPGENYKFLYDGGGCRTLDGRYLEGAQYDLLLVGVQAIIRCKTGEVVFGALAPGDGPPEPDTMSIFSKGV